MGLQITHFFLQTQEKNTVHVPGWFWQQLSATGEGEKGGEKGRKIILFSFFPSSFSYELTGEERRCSRRGPGAGGGGGRWRTAPEHHSRASGSALPPLPAPGGSTADAILESWMLEKPGSALALNSCSRWLASHKLFLAGRLLELLELPSGAPVDQISKLRSNFKWDVKKWGWQTVGKNGRRQTPSNLCELLSSYADSWEWEPQSANVSFQTGSPDLKASCSWLILSGVELLLQRCWMAWQESMGAGNVLFFWSPQWLAGQISLPQFLCA